LRSTKIGSSSSHSSLVKSSGYDALMCSPSLTEKQDTQLFNL
jgi:hypothetical protein